METNLSIIVNTSSPVSIQDRALTIVSEEIGLSLSELRDDVVFTDYGVDSLLSLTILGKFREELDINAESSLFSDYPTVGQLIKYLSQFSLGESDSSFVISDASNNIATPPETNDDGPGPGEDEVMASISNIIAEEIGLSTWDISGELNLSELGMDSLLSLTVLGRLREELEMDLPAEFFNENPTLGQISKMLASQANSANTDIRNTAEAVKTQEAVIASVKETPLHPPATSILLQGNPKIAKKKLFLFPDGSGSATSYANMQPISPDICVYGLNCPYMKTPENLTCSLESLTAPYLAEIRRRQPTGPYYLGGWSAGGICAFDAAQQLYKSGEKVSRLILLDSPNPIGISKLPPRLYTFFNTLGLFGTSTAPPPSWLLPHFLAFINALDRYRIAPFADPASAPPKTYILWATDGVCKNADDPRPEPQPDDPREMSWLLENRTDFGPNGWDGLVGGRENLVIERLEGVNHFEMMEGGEETGLALVGFLRRALA
jgi:naphtho-gamma-pyrone polyketide synthase